MGLDAGRREGGRELDGRKEGEGWAWGGGFPGRAMSS